MSQNKTKSKPVQKKTPPTATIPSQKDAISKAYVHKNHIISSKNSAKVPILQF